MDLIEFKEISSGNFQRHPWELARQKILSYLLKHCGNPVSLIDIGSGDGFLATGLALQHPLLDVRAVDIHYSDTLLETLNQSKPDNLHFTKQLDAFTTISKIDVVILMDVLEHVEFPEKLLQDIRRLPGISADTYYIITLPAFQQLFSQHDRNLGHFRRYTLKSLQQLLQPNRINMLKKGYCFNSLLLPRLLQTFFEKKSMQTKTGSTSIHNWTGSRWLTVLLTNLFWIEFKISWYLARIGIKIPGLTCYSICQPYP